MRRQIILFAAGVFSCGGAAGTLGRPASDSGDSTDSNQVAEAGIVDDVALTPNPMDDANEGEASLRPCPLAGGRAISGVPCVPASTIPSGVCSDGTAACAFCSYVLCPSGEVGPRQFYQCSCRTSSWECALVSQDTSACLPLDASDRTATPD